MIPKKLAALRDEMTKEQFPKHKPPFDKETEHGHKLITNLWSSGFDAACELLLPEMEALEATLWDAQKQIHFIHCIGNSHNALCDQLAKRLQSHTTSSEVRGEY